ncbi:tyrosine recombinase XerC (plasmid) [Streptomyces xanthophaeus]|uniref:site-specific integrase n=1 Tax=Streptomyces xanthophaeus TaxID=67385 RepID=UPI0039903914
MQIDGQLGLFATPPRVLLRGHDLLIQDREISDLPLLVAQLEEMAVERGVSDSWLRMTRAFGRLALAAREPGERLVRPEDLTDLPTMAPTMAEALQRAGLLAKPRPRIVPATHLAGGSCDHCLAWANDRSTVCVPCVDWRLYHPEVASCSRCRRCLPLGKGLCRFCTLVRAENDLDIHGADLEGGDQLWFGGPFALKLMTQYAPGQQAPRNGRFEARRRTAKASSLAARPLSPHLVDPAQQALFQSPARDWRRLDEGGLPALTSDAEALIADFVDYTGSRGWTREDVSSSLRVLRILAAHLGVEAPFAEADIRSLASRSSNHQCARAIDYLRRRRLLEETQPVDVDLTAARDIAAALPQPFAGPVNTWIDILIGKSTKPSLPVRTATARRYVKEVAPVLKHWAAAGISDLREITKDHIEDVLKNAVNHAVKVGQHVALRSLFRALRRERLIFRDPARDVSLHRSPHLPTPLPSDLLRGLLEKVPDTRSRLIVALAAVHGLTTAELRRLQSKSLDRAEGRLRVIRPGRPDHIVFLDETTLALTTAWAVERHRRWPYTTNPHLLVSRVTAASDKNAQVSKLLVNLACQPTGITAAKLRQDRILDEAHENADAVHLMQLFGLSAATAIKFVATAHPADIRPDPIAP